MRSIEEIKADLAAAYEARRNALLAQSYSLDTGQSRQSVTRARLDEINRTIAALEAELEEAADSGVINITLRRY